MRFPLLRHLVDVTIGGLLGGVHDYLARIWWDGFLKGLTIGLVALLLVLLVTRRSS